MGYAAPSDPLLAFAWYSGIAVLGLTLLLLATIAALRYGIDRRLRIEGALAERWRQVFIHAIEGVPLDAPPLFGRDRQAVLMIWLHFTESIRGEARSRLRQLAIDIKLERTALKLLVRANLRLRLMAIVALGRLNAADAWNDLARFVTDRNPMLSLLAARSLLQLDAARALPLLLGELVRREDWPLGRVADALREIKAEVLAPPLLEALRRVTPANAPRLLKLLEVVQVGDTWPLLAPLLEETQAAEVLTAALKACRDPRALGRARALTRHDQWIVRAQAAATLGQLGTSEDSSRLTAMLGDAEWWVRYHAGQALAALPFMSRRALEDLRAGLEDRFAADILAQVLAENALQAPP